MSISELRSAQLDGRRILLAEDESLIALHVADDLEDVGGEIVGPAARVKDAVSLAEKAQIDVGVLDINLGGEAIWPVAEILQRRGIPFVFLTGYAIIPSVPPNFAAVPKLNKPCTQDILVRAVQALLT
jgi:CheY-like chemotaxis protein